MATSVREMKDRLRAFLADPQSERDFRVWFAQILRDVHKQGDADVEFYAHEVQRVLSDASRGLYTPEELTAALTKLGELEAKLPDPISAQPQINTFWWTLKAAGRGDVAPDRILCGDGLFEDTIRMESGNCYMTPSPSGSFFVATGKKTAA